MAVTNLVAGPTSDSYVSLIEANAYVGNRPDATNWNNVDFLERDRLLRQAAIDIDTLRFKGHRLFAGANELGREFIPASSIFDVLNYGFQRLQFPRDWHEYYVGYAQSGTTTTLIDINFNRLPRADNFFKFGAIYILNGTNIGESREITAYVQSTGTFTVSPAFTNAIDSSSSYLIITPIDPYAKYGQIEQAIYLSNNFELSRYQEWRNAGIVSRSIGDVSIQFSGPRGNIDVVGGFISVNAFRYIQRFLDKNVRSGRA
jgi:hypothetical protein